jgi:predicted DNA-binding transcriptional regulator AlpA
VEFLKDALNEAKNVREALESVSSILGRVESNLRSAQISLSKKNRGAKRAPPVVATSCSYFMASKEDEAAPSRAGRGVAERSEVGGIFTIGRALTEGQRAMLTAIASYPEPLELPQVIALTGYARSTRDRLLQELGARRYVQKEHGRVRATPAGIAALGPDFQPLPKNGRALYDYWRRNLNEGQRAVFDVIAAAYPRAISREEISERTKYARSTRDRLIQELGARRIWTKDGDKLRLSEVFA